MALRKIDLEHLILFKWPCGIEKNDLEHLIIFKWPCGIEKNDLEHLIIFLSGPVAMIFQFLKFPFIFRICLSILVPTSFVYISKIIVEFIGNIFWSDISLLSLSSRLK